jgi:hypothetical protein
MLHLRTKVRSRLSSAIAAAVAAATCVAVTPANAAPTHHLPAFRARPAGTTGTTYVSLYVADQANNAVWQFDGPAIPACLSPGHAPAVVTPSDEFSGYFNYPQGVAVSRVRSATFGSDELVVANYLGNNIEIFDGPPFPLATFSAGLNGPTSVQVSADSIYVANAGPMSPGSPYSDIVVYGSGSAVPTSVWQSPTAGVPIVGIGLENPANGPDGGVHAAYASNDKFGILSCPLGSPTCSNMNITTNADPFPIGTAVDSSYTHVFIASNASKPAPSVKEYNYPAGTLCATFTPVAGNYGSNLARKPMVRPSLTGVGVGTATF